MPTQMTMRDHFAAAALTGLLAQGDDGSFSEESYARAAYRWADAMLRERGNRQAALDSSTVTEPMPKEKRAEVYDKTEPVAWAVDVSGMLQVVLLGGESYARFEAKGIRRDGGDGTVVPLYRRPQPTLTDAEREAVERSAAAWEADARMGLSDGGVAATLRGLLGRIK